MIPAQPTPADPIAQLLTTAVFYGSEDHLPLEALLDEIDAIVPIGFRFTIPLLLCPPARSARSRLTAAR